jgi:hypothetical protein
VLLQLPTGTGPFVIPSMRLTDIERAICEKDPRCPVKPGWILGETPESRTHAKQCACVGPCAVIWTIPSCGDARSPSAVIRRRSKRVPTFSVISMAS